MKATTDRITFGCGAVIALLGAVFIASWGINFTLLVRLLPEMGYMAPNAALCFVLAGTWLMLPGQSHRRVRLMLGSLVTGVAGTVLAQYLTGTEVANGQWQLLMNAQPAAKSSAFHGTMSPITALALLLSGMAMILLAVSRGRLVVVLSVSCSLVAGFVVLLGFTSNISGFEIFFTRQPAHMPNYTGMALVVLNAALVWLGYRSSAWNFHLFGEDKKTVFVTCGILVFTTLLAGLLVFTVTEHQAEDELRRGLARSLGDRIGIFIHDLESASAAAESIANGNLLFRRRMAEFNGKGITSPDTQEISEVLDNIVLYTRVSGLALYDAQGRLLGQRGRFSSSPAMTVSLNTPRHSLLLWDRGFILNTKVPMFEKRMHIGTMMVEIPLIEATRVLRDTRGLGESGEMFVCGAYAAGWIDCFPTRYITQVNKHARAPDGLPLPVEYALLGQTGTINTADYRKQRVIAAHAPLGNLGLGAVLKQDESEFYSPARKRMYQIAPLLLLILGAGFLLVRWQVLPLVQKVVSGRNRVNLILDNVGEGIITFDDKGVITSFNHAAATIFGYTPEMSMSNDLSMRIPGLFRHDSGTARMVSLEDFPALKKAVEMEGRRWGGATFAMELAVNEVMLESGKAYIAIVRDITQRKLAGNILWQQSQIIEQSHDAIFSMDLNGMVSSWNRGAEQLFGYSRETIFGKSIQLICPSPECDFCRDGMFQEFISHGGGALETALRRSSGDTFYAHLSLSLLKNNEGIEAGLVGYAVDITPRKLAESSLRESEEKFKSMTTNVPGVVFQFMLQTGGKLSFAFASDGAMSVCGLKPEVLMADASGFLAQILPKERDAFYASMGESVRRMEPWNWEGRIHAAGQNVKWVNWRASPRLMPDGDVLWDGVMLNITESKTAELDIKQSREQLRNLSSHLQTVREEEKAHIAREVHDELGGTLTALKMDTFWLSKRLSPEQVALRQKTDSMAKLIDTAVQATRRITTELRPTILDDLGLLAAIEWQAAEFQNRMGISCEVNGGMFHAEIGEASAIALFRIFQEALTNVARHAQATSVAVELRNDGDDIILSVHDNGRGVSEEWILNSTSHGIRGMFERASHLGGELKIQGTQGEGTVITVKIPGREIEKMEAMQ